MGMQSDKYETFSSDFSSYGDYMYWFNEQQIDFDNDDSLLCSKNIHSIHHKVCIDYNADTNHQQIHFAATAMNEYNELENVLLSFDDSRHWDTISHINARNDDLQTTLHSTQKCKSLQSIQICATKSNPYTNNIRLTLKYGHYKFFKSSAHQSVDNLYNDYYEMEMMPMPGGRGRRGKSKKKKKRKKKSKKKKAKEKKKKKKKKKKGRSTSKKTKRPRI